MIEQGLGISILPELVLDRCPYNIVTKSLSPSVRRTISLAYKDKRVLPIASRYFIDFLIKNFKETGSELKISKEAFIKNVFYYAKSLN